MSNKNILLTICVPTYNRAEILKGHLDRIMKQLDGLSLDELEILVSNNCSTDNTDEVVNSFINLGMPILYNKNSKNLGSNGNFLVCMSKAQGKYIWLLGDDDYLTEGAIAYLLNIIRDTDYGVLYLDSQTKCIEKNKEYNNHYNFIKDISYFYTFMSSFIFRREIVFEIDNPERYIPSWLIQMPFYIKSTFQHETNIIIKEKIFSTIGLDSKNNGGYNFFEVFVFWYNKIWGEYIDDKKLLQWLKKDIWPFVWKYTVQLLIKRDKGNFKTDNGLIILFKTYGNKWYFWWSFIKYPFGVIKRKVKKIL